jgi:hypothetical protein
MLIDLPSTPRSIKTDTVYGPSTVNKRWKNVNFTAVNVVNTVRKRNVLYRYEWTQFYGPYLIRTVNGMHSDRITVRLR